MGPVIGGILYNYFGFENTMNISMIFEVVLAFLFFCFNCGTNVLQKDKVMQETIKKLKELGEKRKKKLDHDESGELMSVA